MSVHMLVFLLLRKVHNGAFVTNTVHPESIHIFPHFVMLQSYSKMDSRIFPLNILHNTHNDKVKKFVIFMK